MASGLSLQSKIAKVLARLQATPRIVYLREVAVAGGNALLGLGQTPTTTDTLVDPQPAVTLLSAGQIATSSGTYTLGDYEFTFAGSVPEATLRKSLIVYGDEVLAILEMEPGAYQGVVVVWRVVARTIKSGS